MPTASACDARTIDSSVARAAPESMAAAATLIPSRTDRDAAGDEQRRAGIQHHDITRRAGLALQHPRTIAAFSAASPPSSSAERRLANAELRRVDVERVHRTVAALGHLGVAGRRDLVDAVGAVHDPGARRPEQPQRAREQLGQLGTRHADDLPRRAGGIGQRAEQVERRPHAQLAPRRRRVLHRRMERRREEERDVAASCSVRSTTAGAAARFTPSCSNTSALPQRLDTDRLPCLATLTPHAATTSAAADEMLNVPARSPPVPQVSNTSPSGLDSFTAVLAHRPREADDLGRPLAFHRQRRQQRRERRGRGAAFHDLAHGGRGLVGR